MQNNCESSVQEATCNNEFDLELFFNLTPTILCIASRHGVLKKVNPSFAKILGYNVDELVNKHVKNFMHPDDVEPTSNLRKKISVNQPMINYENRYISKSGETVWLSWTSIFEPTTKLIYAVAKDISHVKELEEKKNSLFLELTKTNIELKQFAYTTSHDLRSPIDNIISLFSFMDFSKTDSEQNITYMEMFYTSILKLKQTINNHLETLGTKNKINIDVKEINLNDILKIVTDSVSELITKSKATIITDFSEVLHIKFSSFYLQSIFLNLITNSIKYAHPDRSLILSITSKSINNRTVLIFSDNGIGFNSKDMNGDIFSLHHTLHNHEDSKGIGLFLVKSHMESMGGSVDVQSEENVGTTFTLTF